MALHVLTNQQQPRQTNRKKVTPAVAVEKNLIKMSGFGLEEIGIPGRDYLREALTSCTDPLKAIEDFQIENGILLPSLRPMLPLLDLHGIKRLDFHNSVLEDLREKLISQIEALTNASNPREKERKLKELLNKSFPVIKIKQLRPVVMCVLKNLPFIEDR